MSLDLRHSFVPECVRHNRGEHGPGTRGEMIAAANTGARGDRSWRAHFERTAPQIDLGGPKGLELPRPGLEVRGGSDSSAQFIGGFARSTPLSESRVGPFYRFERKSALPVAGSTGHEACSWTIIHFLLILRNTSVRRKIHVTCLPARSVKSKVPMVCAYPSVPAVV